VFALAGALIAGCGGSSPAKPTPTPTPTPAPTPFANASLKVSPSKPFMLSGNTQQLNVTATFPDGRTMTTGFDVRWASLNESVATVDANGLVTAWRQGFATITATTPWAVGVSDAEVHSGIYRMKGLVTQTAPKEEPVTNAKLIVLDGRYKGITGGTRRDGTFVMPDVVGTATLRVSAPYFQDAEVPVNADSRAVVRLAPLPGMIIDAIAGSGGGDRQLTFDQRQTGVAHLTVSAPMSDTTGFEVSCGELRDDGNRLLWQTRASDEATTTLTLTGGKRYTLKVYDCSVPQFRGGMTSYLLRAEHL